MKIYTQTYDLAKASPHRFWVAPFSEFKIGIKILEKDEISSKDFTLKAGSIEFTPDEDKIDNFTLYTIKSNDTGFVDYTIEVEGVAEKLKLMQIVTDSTVFEIDAGGGGDVPADVATQTWVNSQISDFITEDALDGYATESYVDSAISDFVTDDELTGYATKDQLTGYVETDDLTAYAEKTDLTAYATKDELTAYAEISDIKDSTITFTQGGVTKGSFTLNQATSATIALDAGGGDMSNYYTKSETNGLLSEKADATKQLPADLTSWMTDGWYAYYEDPETGDQEQRDFTKLTAGFYDISPYCDYTVSAQYVYGWDGYYYSTRLFSYCTNGKTVFCHQLDGRDVMDGTDYEGNISGNPSCYFEVDTTKIPNDEGLGRYLYDNSVVDADSVKWFAYVSQNMDGNAPYTLQELTTFGDNDPLAIGNNEFYHVATGDVTPGFIEVSAVYDNQISSKVDQQYLQDNYLNSDGTYQMITNEVSYALEDYYPKTETSSATEIGTALAGKQPTGNYLTAETEPAFAAMSADIVVDDDLTAYYTKSETSSATELSGEFSTVSALADSAYNMAEGATISLGDKVDHKAGGTAPEVTNIQTYYESEYSQLSVDDPTWEPDENTMYVILPDQV